MRGLPAHARIASVGTLRSPSVPELRKRRPSVSASAGAAMTSRNDDYTLLDRLQDLGAWVLFLGAPAFVVAILGLMFGWWT